MTLNNNNNELSKRQIEEEEIQAGRKARPMQIRTGGIVVGVKGKGYVESRPRRVGDVLQGSSEDVTGMTWAPIAGTAGVQFKRNNSDTAFFMEAKMVEGSVTSTGTNPYTVTIDTGIPNLIDKLIGIGSILLFNAARLSSTDWYYEGLTKIGSTTQRQNISVSVDDKNIVIGNQQASGVYSYRILLWIKRGTLDIKPEEKEEV